MGARLIATIKRELSFRQITPVLAGFAVPRAYLFGVHRFGIHARAECGTPAHPLQAGAIGPERLPFFSSPRYIRIPMELK
jgi:hypothetical protein